MQVRGVTHLWTVQEGNPRIPAQIVNGQPKYWTGFSPNLNQAIIASGFGSGDSIIDLLLPTPVTGTTPCKWWCRSALGHGLEFVSNYTYGKCTTTWQGRAIAPIALRRR